MGKIVMGDKKWNVPDIPEKVVFTISPKCFKGVRQSAVKAVIEEDLAELLVFGYEIVKDREIPETFSEKEIKYDILEKDDHHDREVCKVYLKQTRKWWESKYDFEELWWLTNFAFCISEIGGNVGPEWFRLYQMIRGDLPEDFPVSICFAIMIENVRHWKIEKSANKIVTDYFHDNPDKISEVLSLRVPDDIIVDSDRGLTFERYIKGAKWFKERMV